MFQVERVLCLNNGAGTLKAFADVSVFDGGVPIRGFRVIDGKKGLFVGMPRISTQGGKWVDQVSMTPKAKKTLTLAILQAYQEAAHA